MTGTVSNMLPLFPIILSFRIILYVIPFLVAFSFLIAYIAVGAKPWIRSMLDLLVNMPLIFPPIATGFLLVHFLGGHGIIGRLFGIDLMFTFSGLITAAFIAGMPFIAQSMVTGVNENLYRLCEASFSTGKGKVQTFFRIVVPSLKRNIIAGTVLASARILGEVGMSLMIGGNITGKTNTVSLEIYNKVLDGENGQALQMSLLLFFLSGTAFIFIKILNYKEQ